MRIPQPVRRAAHWFARFRRSPEADVVFGAVFVLLADLAGVGALLIGLLGGGMLVWYVWRWVLHGPRRSARASTIRHARSAPAGIPPGALR